MKTSLLTMGIDLGTSGVRIAVLNEKKVLLHSAEMEYPSELSEWRDWKECCRILIKEIPKSLKKRLTACAVDGTSGTLLACNKKGKPLGAAIPYHISCPEQEQALSKILPNKGIASSINSSLAKALRIIDQFGSELLLRHQSDWITGWLLGNWDWGEESNNLRMGWDPQKKLWEPNLEELSWHHALPIIVESGSILSTLASDKAEDLGLPKDLLIIAGTTDANAAAISAELEKKEGLTILGSTIVVKSFINKPIKAIGITNHRVLNRWLCGGASNTGGSVLRKFFTDKDLQELSQQINPEIDSGLRLRPMLFKGERFPINDPHLEPILEPRPISDSLYLHGILEGLARIEYQGWQKLIELGVPRPQRIITIGGGSKNPQWRRIRERTIGIPIKKSIKTSAQGAALIALKAISHKSKV